MLHILFSGEPAIRSRYARLIVLMPPEPPKISGGPVIEAVEDSEVNLECVSVGGKPPAEVKTLKKLSLQMLVISILC